MTTPRSLFLLACIPTRILFAILPTVLSPTRLKYYGILLLAIGIGFHVLFWTKSRLDAAEAGGVTWWHNLRALHGSLYLAAGILAINGNQTSWIPLAIDVVIGLLAHLHHYY
jgi:hypothetical protein